MFMKCIKVIIRDYSLIQNYQVDNFDKIPLFGQNGLQISVWWSHPDSDKKINNC